MHGSPIMHVKRGNELDDFKVIKERRRKNIMCLARNEKTHLSFPNQKCSYYSNFLIHFLLLTKSLIVCRLDVQIF